MGLSVFCEETFIFLLLLVAFVDPSVTNRTNENRIAKNATDEHQARAVGGGAVYTRWGRTDCMDGIHTELVYHGYAGGTYYDSTGGASDYLCLPRDPQWGSYNEVTNGLGEVWGAEYQMASFPFTLRNEGPSTLQDHNVPCAVCRAKTRASVLMVPARQECYEGWTREYSGYLTSGHKAHKGRTQFACMDDVPNADVAGYRNENGALFYPVDGMCGSLPCPPYINGRELTCVVCTK